MKVGEIWKSKPHVDTEFLMVRITEINKDDSVILSTDLTDGGYMRAFNFTKVLPRQQFINEYEKIQ